MTEEASDFGGMFNCAFFQAASFSTMSRVQYVCATNVNHSSNALPVLMRIGRIRAVAFPGICALRLATVIINVVSLSLVLSTLVSAVAWGASQVESAAPERYRPRP